MSRLLRAAALWGEMVALALVAVRAAATHVNMLLRSPDLTPPLQYWVFSYFMKRITGAFSMLIFIFLSMCASSDSSAQESASTSAAGSDAPGSSLRFSA